MRIAKKNPLLDENKYPISLYERFNIPNKAIFINEHLCQLSLSKALPQDLKNEITLKRKELSGYFKDLTHYATLTLDPFVITLNQKYWGRDYVNCEIESILLEVSFISVGQLVTLNCGFSNIISSHPNEYFSLSSSNSSILSFNRLISSCCLFNKLTILIY